MFLVSKMLSTWEILACSGGIFHGRALNNNLVRVFEGG